MTVLFRLVINNASQNQTYHLIMKFETEKAYYLTSSILLFLSLANAQLYHTTRSAWPRLPTNLKHLPLSIYISFHLPVFYMSIDFFNKKC